MRTLKVEIKIEKNIPFQLSSPSCKISKSILLMIAKWQCRNISYVLVLCVLLEYEFLKFLFYLTLSSLKFFISGSFKTQTNVIALNTCHTLELRLSKNAFLFLIESVSKTTTFLVTGPKFFIFTDRCTS